MVPSTTSIYGSLHELIQTQPRNLLHHSQSVALLAEDLAKAAGCSSGEAERIRTGSLLHDIGKQFISASILEKEADLSPMEYCRIQQHAWLGYAYLSSFVSESIILNTVLYHHERWNGTGYPYGLSAEQIPLGARICALADVWDALVSERCYRSAWSMTQAAELIWAGAGSLFDPQLAHQFLNMLEAQYRHGSCPELQQIPALPMARGMSLPENAYRSLACEKAC